MNGANAKKIAKRIALFGGIIFLILLSRYAYLRLVSQQNALRIYALPQAKQTPQPSAQKQLRVTSFNIAHARGAAMGVDNWQKGSQAELLAHLDHIAKQLRATQADVIVLNEVDFSTAWSFHLNQAEYIAHRAAYPHVAEQRNYDIAVPFFNFRFGNAILSRYPLYNIQFIDLPPYSQWEDRFAGNHDALTAMLDTPIGTVSLLAVHLEYRSEKIRVQCIQQLLQWAKKQPFPIIAAGDFNATLTGFPGARHTADGLNAMTLLLQEGGFHHASALSPKLLSFPSEQPKTLIDWVIGKGAITIHDFQVHPAALSDHLMVTATVVRSASKP